MFSQFCKHLYCYCICYISLFIASVHQHASSICCSLSSSHHFNECITSILFVIGDTLIIALTRSTGAKINPLNLAGQSLSTLFTVKLGHHDDATGCGSYQWMCCCPEHLNHRRSGVPEDKEKATDRQLNNQPAKTWQWNVITE